MWDTQLTVSANTPLHSLTTSANPFLPPLPPHTSIEWSCDMCSIHRPRMTMSLPPFFFCWRTSSCSWPHPPARSNRTLAESLSFSLSHDASRYGTAVAPSLLPSLMIMLTPRLWGFRTLLNWGGYMKEVRAGLCVVDVAHAGGLLPCCCPDPNQDTSLNWTSMPALHAGPVLLPQLRLQVEDPCCSGPAERSGKAQRACRAAACAQL